MGEAVTVTLGRPDRLASGRAPSLYRAIVQAVRATTGGRETVAATLDRALLEGYRAGRAGARVDYGDSEISAIRQAVGFAHRPADLLTPPSANLKLGKASAPSYGLTLAHGDLAGWEACPYRGDCHGVCVIGNGNGRYSSTQRAWIWRTAYLATDPVGALYRIGLELGRAVRRHGAILNRPNVNSDLLWHDLVPSIGALEGVTVYGYTKWAGVLRADPAGLGGIRYAYSWNEHSSLEAVRDYLRAGGAVAILASHRPGSRPDYRAIRDHFGPIPGLTVTDADRTDEWILRARPGRPVIGALSAKGKARQLIGRSGFVLL